VDIKKRIAGLKSKRSGEQFERFFEIRCRQLGISCVRIPDGCRQIGPKQTMRVKTPFDYIVGFGKSVIFVDLKSTTSNRFTYSQIDQFQLKALSLLSQHQGAGYLIYYRTSQELVYYKAGELLVVERGSGLEDSQGIRLGKIFEANLRGLFSDEKNT